MTLPTSMPRRRGRGGSARLSRTAGDLGGSLVRLGRGSLVTLGGGDAGIGASAGVFGAASVLYWRATDDLRPYALVQFFPMLAIPLMLILFPTRHTGTWGIVAMMAFYALAKLLEWQDHSVAAVIATGGHPWKHTAAAAGVYCYVLSVRRLLCYPVSQVGSDV